MNIGIHGRKESSAIPRICSGRTIRWSTESIKPIQAILGHRPDVMVINEMRARTARICVVACPRAGSVSWRIRGRPQHEVLRFHPALERERREIDTRGQQSATLIATLPGRR